MSTGYCSLRSGVRSGQRGIRTPSCALSQSQVVPGTSDFSVGDPWIGIPDNHRYINVAVEEQDADSILNYYKKLVRLRKQYAVIQKGAIVFLCQGQSEIFGYKRIFEKQEFLVVNNLTGDDVALQDPVLCEGYAYLIGNYQQETFGNILKILKPYQSIVLLKTIN